MRSECMALRKCERCGNELESNSLFCTKCGNRMDKKEKKTSGIDYFKSASLSIDEINEEIINGNLKDGIDKLTTYRCFGDNHDDIEELDNVLGFETWDDETSYLDDIENYLKYVEHCELDSVGLIASIQQDKELSKKDNYVSDSFFFTDKYMIVHKGFEIEEDIDNLHLKRSNVFASFADFIVFPLKNIEYISISSEKEEKYINAHFVTTQKSPVAGAIIGGMVAGTTGAIVGALSNTGTKTYLQSGYKTKEKIYHLIIKFVNIDELYIVYGIKLFKSYEEDDEKKFKNKIKLINNYILLCNSDMANQEINNDEELLDEYINNNKKIKDSFTKKEDELSHIMEEINEKEAERHSLGLFNKSKKAKIDSELAILKETYNNKRELYRKEKERILKEITSETEQEQLITEKLIPEGKEFKCRYCGNITNIDYTFCCKCNAKLKKNCLYCGKLIKANTDYCKYCGKEQNSNKTISVENETPIVKKDLDILKKNVNKEYLLSEFGKITHDEFVEFALTSLFNHGRIEELNHDGEFKFKAIKNNLD